MESQTAPVFPPPLPPKKRRFTTRAVLVLVLIGLLCGSFIGYAVTYVDFSNRLNSLQSQLGYYQGSNGGSQSTYFLNDSENISLSSLYSQVKSSVVVIKNLVPQYGFFGGLMGYSLQQGSGFVVKVNNQLVVVTNNHVIENSINVTVTFANGDSLPAKVLGSDPKADLAILSVSPMPSYAVALTLVSSATLHVGDPVVAVGSPYGLSGTLTTGVISALGRTITLSDGSGSSSLTIADMIQTSTAINSGNSGGPLINYAGEVVGITTAAVSNSEGLGFAVPSSTIIREIGSLVSTGSYDQHPSINAAGTDMNYQIAQAMDAPVTYGWLVESVSRQNGLEGGDTQKSIMGSKVIIGGDIITAINDQRVTNGDDLLSYLERHALPGQTMSFTVIRDGETQTVQVTIGNA